MRSKLSLVLLIVALVSACSSAETESTPEILTTREMGNILADNQYHPLSTRTGLKEIDVILAAVESGNVANLFVFLQTTCATVNALGGPPPCREGEAEGTPVEVMPFLESEGSFFRKDEIQNWVGLDVTGIYAVYEVSDTAFSDQYYPTGDYAIALVSSNKKPSVILQVHVDGIVRIDYVFNAYGSTLADVLQRDAVYLILAPVTP